MDCLQNWHVSPNLLHTLTESGAFVLSISAVSISVTGVSGVLGFLVFMGSYLVIFHHLALILPEAPLSCVSLCHWGGCKLESIIPL